MLSLRTSPQAGVVTEGNACGAIRFPGIRQDAIVPTER